MHDAILIDECSQLDNSIARKLNYAVDELPQKPVVALEPDYQQIQPVGAAGIMQLWCKGLTTITLNAVYRTDDPELLEFLNSARES